MSIGIAFPFSRTSTAFPATSSGDDAVADNIRRILLTPLGSRVMRPALGSLVMSMVFENTGALLTARITAETRRAIAVGEPRASVVSVNVTESDEEITVDVEYEVRGRRGSTAVVFTS